MFGSLGLPELLLIFAVILIVFGPRRIPEIGRTLGKAMGEFRKATDDLKNTIEREVRLEELKQTVPTLAEFTTPFQSVSRSEPALVPAVSPVGAEAGLLAGSGVDESSSLPVDESSSRQVVEEQTQPELPAPVSPSEQQTQPELSSAVPLDDSIPRRLDDSTATTGTLDDSKIDDPEKAESA